MILSSSFWPTFWALIGGGVAIAAVLALFVAGRTRPGSEADQPAARIEPDRRHDEQAPRHQRAA
jgi:hypothetical protein